MAEASCLFSYKWMNLNLLCPCGNLSFHKIRHCFEGGILNLCRFRGNCWNPQNKILPWRSSDFGFLGLINESLPHALCHQLLCCFVSAAHNSSFHFLIFMDQFCVIMSWCVCEGNIFHHFFCPCSKSFFKCLLPSDSKWANVSVLYD